MRFQNLLARDWKTSRHFRKQVIVITVSIDITTRKSDKRPCGDLPHLQVGGGGVVEEVAVDVRQEENLGMNQTIAMNITAGGGTDPTAGTKDVLTLALDQSLLPLSLVPRLPQRVVENGILDNGIKKEEEKQVEVGGTRRTFRHLRQSNNVRMRYTGF